MDRGAKGSQELNMTWQLICHHTHTHAILSFAATCMDLEITILSEINQTKTDTALYHLYVEIKKKYK